MLQARLPLCALLWAARATSAVVRARPLVLPSSPAGAQLVLRAAARGGCVRAVASSAAAKKGSKKGGEPPAPATNFLRNIIKADLSSGKHDSIVTRFPPEPNGYLHIGHAKSICVNFGLGEEFAGTTYMRFDDTNPEKEEQEYIDAIQRDVRWLGFDWKEEQRLTYASNYFEQFFEYALVLIREGKAYVDSLTPEQMREYRGTLKTPGRDSPYRDRSVEENLALFEAMAAGEVRGQPPAGHRRLAAGSGARPCPPPFTRPSLGARF